MKKEKIVNGLLLFSFVFYALFVICNILFKYVMPWDLLEEGRYFARSFNLIPFADLAAGNYNRLDVWGNIILFVPLGIYLPLCRKYKFGKTVAASAAVSTVLEISQYLFAIGACDITDIIYNTFGCLLGFLCFRLLLTIFKNHERVKVFTAAVANLLLLFVALITFLIYLNN